MEREGGRGGREGGAGESESSALALLTWLRPGAGLRLRPHLERISRARPKSASFTTSPFTRQFSGLMSLGRRREKSRRGRERGRGDEHSASFSQEAPGRLRGPRQAPHLWKKPCLCMKARPWKI